MGESIKVHSQALVGYEDEIMPNRAAGRDAVTDHNLMGMETAY